MVLYQPDNQIDIAFTQAMCGAELFRIESSQFRVVSAATLAYVVKQACQIEQFNFG
jgi:hypothetical protein